MSTAKSEELFERAQAHIPGGVNSPVRAFRGVGGTPLFIKRGEGSHLYDVDGNSYIDYVCSWGPDFRPSAAASGPRSARRSRNRHSFGAPTAQEVELAE